MGIFKMEKNNTQNNEKELNKNQKNDFNFIEEILKNNIGNLVDEFLINNIGNKLNKFTNNSFIIMMVEEIKKSSKEIINEFNKIINK
jgi:hypothetical protein